MVLPIALTARPHSTFLVQLVQRLFERQNGLDWRGEPEVSIGFHAGPLVIEVETQRARIAFCGQQSLASGKHKAKSRHALDALVRRGDEKVDMRTNHVDGYRAKATHRIHDVASSGAVNKMANFFHLIQHSAGG